MQIALNEEMRKKQDEVDKYLTLKMTKEGEIEIWKEGTSEEKKAEIRALDDEVTQWVGEQFKIEMDFQRSQYKK